MKLTQMRRRNKACYLDGEALVNVEIEGSAGRFAECRKRKELICIGIYIYIYIYIYQNITLSY